MGSTIVVAVLLLVLSGCSPLGNPAPPGPSTVSEFSRFSIVVIPDTQHMIEDPDNHMVGQMVDWIVAQRDELGIEFVTHVGDVVDHGSSAEEWQRADAAMESLDGILPYSVGLGNHDYAEKNEKDSSTAYYRNYFGAQRYAGRSWYAGTGPGQTNHYQIFEAGNRRFLHISLEWEPPGPATDPSTPLGWARSVIEEHQDLPTIITTHAYLWDKPGLEGRFPSSDLRGYVEDAKGNRSYPGTSGQGIFEVLVYPHPQVFMVLGGHYHWATGTDQGEYHQVSTNAAGQPVYEMLSDYQEYPEGGQGYLRIIEFIPGGGEGGLDRIEVNTYSPVLDASQVDARSDFHFDLSFEERWVRD